MCQKCLIFTDNEICLIENSFVDSGNKFKRHRNKKEFFFFNENGNAGKEKQYYTDNPKCKPTQP